MQVLAAPDGDYPFSLSSFTSAIMPVSCSSPEMKGERVVRATSSGMPIGIQPCTVAARRRLSLELPPIQIGIGFCVGRGRWMTPLAVKWMPLASNG